MEHSDTRSSCTVFPLFHTAEIPQGSTSCIRVECKGTRVVDVKMMRNPMDSVDACSSKSPRMLFNAELVLSGDQIHSQSADEYCLGCEH